MMGNDLKTYDRYKDSGYDWLGMIPEHWEQTLLKNCFDEVKELNKDYEFKQAFSFKFGEIVNKKQLGTEEELMPTYIKYTKVKVDDIIVNGLNLNYDFLTQRVGLVKDDGIITSAYIALRCQDNYDSRFACHFLKFLDYKKMLNGMGRGIRLTLSFNELRTYYIPLPPLSEQKQIAAYLDYKLAMINKLIKAKKREIELLKEQKQAEINLAVTQGLNPDVPMKDSGVEWIGMIPEHWEVRRLGTIGSLQNGITKSGNDFGFGDTFISYSDVYKNPILPETPIGLVNSTKKDQKTYCIQEGDILFTRTSETPEEIGFASTAYKTFQKACFAGFLIRFRPEQCFLNKRYSSHFFRAQILRNFFIESMNIVIRVSLSQGVLRALPVIIPPLKEQIEIADYLDTKTKHLNEAISTIESEIRLVEEYKTSLISEIVTGKVDVRGVVVPQVEMIETEEEMEDISQEDESME